jgi:hypothetical protein
LKTQLDDAWAREWAAQRPEVYPLLERDWVYGANVGPYASGNSRVLPLKNGGKGPALNVRGEVIAVSLGNTYTREIIAGTIASGDLFDARIVPHPGVRDWQEAKGVLRYTDLAGGFYTGHFEFTQAEGNELVAVVHETEHQTPAEHLLRVRDDDADQTEQRKPRTG